MSLYLVTFTTHNSRISDRMVKYNPYGFIKGLKPVLLLGEDYLKMIDLIANGIKRYQIPTTVFTVIPDHVHLLTNSSDEKELNEQIRKLKGYSSYQFQRYKKWEKGTNHVWSQKFHRIKLGATQRDVDNVTNYILNNTEKHYERWGEDLKTGRVILRKLNDELPPPPASSQWA